MNIVRAVWFGAGTETLRTIGETPIGKITLRRSAATIALIPWTKDMDHLAAEVREWKWSIRRCNPASEIAMRDLVSSSGAQGGIVVDALSADVDRAEVDLAAAWVTAGQERYKSLRVYAMNALGWLSARDSEEWPMRTHAEIARLYASRDAQEMDTREIRARNG